MSTCGAMVQPGAALGSSPSAASPPARRIAPAAARGIGSVAPSAVASARRDERGHRHDAHDERGLGRAVAPALDDHRHEQEQRGGERRGGEGERREGGDLDPAAPRRPGRSSTGAGTSRAPAMPTSATGAWSANIASQERRSVSRPPAAGPTAAPSTPAVAHVPRPCSGSWREQQLERRRDDRGARHALRDAAADEEAERRPPPRRRGRPRRTGRGPTTSATSRATAGEHRAGHRGERERDVERHEHPRDLGDRRVQLAQDLRQRERDDRGVGEDEARRERERRAGGPRRYSAGGSGRRPSASIGRPSISYCTSTEWCSR